MAELKAKAKISCETCGCLMSRSKTIKVESTSKEEAIKEAREKVEAWKASLKGKSCAVCRSILSGV